MLSLFIWASGNFFDSEVSSSQFWLGRECMSVTFHSPREKVYNKIFFFCGSLSWLLYICRKSEIEYHRNLCQSTATFCPSDFPRQRYFFLTYKATASLRKQIKPARAYPSLKVSFMIYPRERERERELIASTQSLTWIISARWQIKKIIQLTQLWKSINDSKFFCL